MRDAAMTQTDMKAEINLPPNFFSGWRGYKQDQFGTYGSVSYSPMRGGGVAKEYYSRTSEDKPMKVALKSGDFGVEVFDENGKQVLDLIHVAIVAENPAGDLLSLSALVPKEKGGADQLANYMNVDNRGVFEFVIVNDPKITDMGFVRYIVEDKTLSNYQTRAFMVAINSVFNGSHERVESLTEKFNLPKSLPNGAVFDLRSNAGLPN
jgi:hypothetical protein